jgi:uroporphyrinogen-III synthase
MMLRAPLASLGSKAVSIGPETTRVAESVGLEIAVEAESHDLEGLVDAVQRFGGR